MTKVHCSVPERYANPLFEVFDGGDFVLSSYHDIEESDTRMQIFLADASQAGEARRRLGEALSVVGCEVPVEVSEVPDEDWKLAYRRHFKVEPIGRRLVTVPTWELEDFGKSGEYADRIPIVLDPGMAFGTGKHETTRACLEYIDEIAGNGGLVGAPLTPKATSLRDAHSVRGIRGDRTLCSFLDMGCGSGILSIAAAKLGFSRVAGFDIDEDAVNASRENAAVNGVSVDYRLFALGKGAVTLDESIEAAKGVYPDLALQGRDVSPGASPFAPADFVVANILGPLLIAFADEIAGYAKKTLVISGILTELYPEVLAAFTSRGFREVSRKTIGEWTTGHLRAVRTVKSNEEGLLAAAEVLLSGGVAVIPTDTVYGLAAHPGFPEAVERLYSIKGREAKKPIAMLAADADAIERSGYPIAGRARELVKHWPGGLTLILAKSTSNSQLSTLGSTEGFRVPDHEWTRRLLAACGGLLRVTSANLSGRREATDASAALADVGLSADIVVDDGPSAGGMPSTVARIGPCGETEILRPGAVEI